MKTIQQELVNCTSEQFEQITHLWSMDGETVKGPKARQNRLLQHMQDPIAGRFVWEYLSENERLVLYRLLVPANRNGIRRDTVQNKTGLSTAEFEKTLVALSYYLLVYEEQVKMQGDQLATYAGAASKDKKKALPIEDVTMLYPFNELTNLLYKIGREIYSSTGDRSKMTLDKILTQGSQGELYDIARHYNLQLNQYGYTPTEDLREMIAEEQEQAESVAYILQEFDPGPRLLFKWLCERGGSLPMAEARTYTRFDDATLLTTLHTLQDYALAFDSFSGQDRLLFVPQDRYQYLKKATEQPEPEVEKSGFITLDTSPQAIRHGDPLIVYDLAIIIGAMYQQTIEPTQAGRVPKRLAAKFQPLLHGRPRIRYVDEGDEYLEMLFQIAVELKLLQLSKSSLRDIKPHYESGPQLEQWSQMSIVEQTSMLVQHWPKSHHWLDIAGVHFRQWNPFSWNPRNARPTLVTHLQQCQSGHWYTVKSLLQTIWESDAFVLRTPAYDNSRQQHKTGGMRAKWNACEGEVFIGSLCSTLYELGIVSLGYHQPTVPTEMTMINPDAFLLTDLGTAVLSSLATAPTAPSAHARSRAVPAVSDELNGHRSLVIQPNFELLLLQPDIPTLYSLLPFAQVNQVEMVSRLMLTRASFMRGLEAEMRPDQILQVLRERSQKSIPQNVEYTLGDWARLFKDVKISQIILLEVSNEEQANEICASPKLKQFELRRLGPYAMAVSGEVNLQELRRTLEKEGITVRISGDIAAPTKLQTTSTFGRLR